MEQLTSHSNSAPFLAMVGVSLASGSGIVTKEDEIEVLCHEMRRAVTKTRLLEEEGEEEQRAWCLHHFQLGSPIAKGCSAVVYAARLRHTEGAEDLAVKMMYNYHAESNAFTILRAMQRETVPARSLSLPEAGTDPLGLSDLLECAQPRLRPHPNIVEMLTVFADRVPALPGNLDLYPQALPARLNPAGFGRNMSLFLVMRRYDLSLGDYLTQYKDQISPRTSLVLFTQLLEGIAFLVASGVAHRDLKVDNILLSLTGGPQFPQLVITDFGCCLFDPRLGLRQPHRSMDTDRGGNTALMAPEVVTARPGALARIDYRASDLWTSATLAFQIFGAENPFLVTLSSSRYDPLQLPPLPPLTPPLVRRLVTAILARDPHQRPQPRLCATVCQLLLWAPTSWSSGSHRPDTQEVLQWLLTMTTKVVCESRWGNPAGAQAEYTLVATFLATMDITVIREAIDWIQRNSEETNF